MFLSTATEAFMTRGCPDVHLRLNEPPGILKKKKKTDFLNKTQCCSIQRHKAPGRSYVEER